MDNSSLGIIDFGPFKPDMPDLRNRGAEQARNVLPRAYYYEMLPSVVPISDPLPSRILGATTGTNSLREYFTYAATGDAIYSFSRSSGGWINVSSGYSVADSWQFCQWGDRVIAVSLQNPLQSIIAGGAQFSDLVTSGETIGARQCAIVRSQLFIGDVSDNDGYTPNRIRWSALNDPSDFAVSPTTLSDFQDLKASTGKIQRVFGGEYGLIFTERDVWRASWAGSPVAWQIEKTISDVGLFAPGGAVQWGNEVYFVTEDGFFSTSGSRLTPIGSRKINRTFLDNLKFEDVQRVTAAPFIGEQTIVWAYPTTASSSGTPNKLLMYNYANDTWAEGDEVTDLLFTGATNYIPIDDPETFSSQGLYPTLGDVPASFDSQVWAGEGRLLASATDDFRIGLFNGETREAVLETAELQLVPGRRTFVDYCRPLHESTNNNRPTVLVSIGHRNRQSDPVVYTDERSEDENGIIPFRTDARYTRYRVRIQGDFGQGIGVEAVGRPSGGR